MAQLSIRERKGKELYLRWLVPVSSRGDEVTFVASCVSNTHDTGARFKTRKTKTNMAACGFFRARTLLYCYRRNLHLKETLPARTTLVNSVYLRKIVFGIQCFPSFKGKSIDRDGHMGRIKDSQSGHKYGEWTHQQKICPCSSSPHSMGCIFCLLDEYCVCRR